jgi:aspartyl-tRNA(Asn)/glutamyl-tRNA(Gln) amidotransferase subunit C
MADSRPTFNREDVVHVADLARLDLQDEEIERFTAQLVAILQHVDAVRSLDTSNVSPTSHPLELVNAVRPDEFEPTLDREEVLSQAPEAESGRFKVPPILGEAP